MTPEDVSLETRQRVEYARQRVAALPLGVPEAVVHDATQAVEKAEQFALREADRRRHVRQALKKVETAYLKLFKAWGTNQPGEVITADPEVAVELVGLGLGELTDAPKPTPPPAPPSMVKVQMLRAFEKNNVGDRCAFSEREARVLIQRRFATELKP